MKIEIRPRIEGALAVAAKKPVLGFSAIRVRWRGAGAPGEAGTAEIEAASLHVSSDSIQASDRRKIEAQAREELLEAREHPRIVFHASAARESADGAVRLEGELTIRGQARPMVLEFSRAGGTFRCETAIDLPAFGIRPPSAMLGALRCAPRLPFVIELTPPP